MFAKLKAIVAEVPEEHPSAKEKRMHLACAALMTEVATIDNSYDEAETDALLTALKRQFHLTDADAAELQALAERERHDATSLYQFTSLVNEHCDREQKYQLVVGMWQVAYADGHLDKYEEYIIRRAAELMYLDHNDFIRAKISVKNAT